MANQPKEKINDVKKITHDIILDFLTQLGLDAEIEVSDISDEKDNVGFSYLNVALLGDNLGELIGYRGNMLESVQTIIGLILTKTLAKEGETTKYRVLLDINNYREKREEYLVSYAKRAVEEVLSSKQPIELSPMKPSERRIIHIALKDTEGIETSSAGDGDDRRVVITPKHK